MEKLVMCNDIDESSSLDKISVYITEIKVEYKSYRDRGICDGYPPSFLTKRKLFTSFSKAKRYANYEYVNDFGVDCTVVNEKIYKCSLSIVEEFIKKERTVSTTSVEYYWDSITEVVDEEDITDENTEQEDIIDNTENEHLDPEQLLQG